MCMDDPLHNWATRFRIGMRLKTCLLTSEAGGVDVDNIMISKSTLNMNTDTIVKFEVKIIMKKNLGKISGLKIVVHFDTNLVKQCAREKRISTNEKRIAIGASSPESVPLDFLLGILEVKNSKGSDQVIAIQNTLEYE